MGLNLLRLLQSPNPDKPLGGRYKVLSKLGAGGFGQTFLAEDMHLPDHPCCVVKQLKPQVTDANSLQTARRLFDTEAKVLASWLTLRKTKSFIWCKSLLMGPPSPRN